MNRKIILLILIIAFVAWAVFLPKNLGAKEEVLFKIEKGQGSKEIALNLEKQGLIWWSPLFRLYVLTSGVSGKLQAGTYQLSSSLSIANIVKKFVTGDVAKAKITIPEGFTAKQILQELQRLLSGSDPDSLGELKKHEGYLFPDTYDIPYGMELEKIIEMMTDNFNKKTATLKITPEVVIMASLLEKELQTKEDKTLAAGVLWKRLRIGMPLQVDAYVWTYENQGLPEKPISNPGLESILAAIYPQESQYWYYLSTPEGETIFSKTLEEHNYAKSKYLR